MPEVLRTISLDTFVPDDQPAKLKLIKQGAKTLDPAINPESVDAGPSDTENVSALKDSAESLRKLAGNQTGTGADSTAKCWPTLLSKVAEANQTTTRQVRCRRPSWRRCRSR